MPDPTALVIGLVAAGLGALVAHFRPAWLDPAEAVAVTLLVFGRQSELMASRHALALLAVVLAGRVPDERAWVRWVLVAAACASFVRVGDGVEGWLGLAGAVAALLLVVIGRAGRLSFGPIQTLLGLAWVAAAAYLGTPDTEQVTMAAVGFGLLGVLAARSSWRPSGHAVDIAAVYVAWSLMTGARGREASFVVIAGATVLVLGFALAGASRSIRWATPLAIVLVGVHVGAGVVAARYAALGTDVGTAVGRAAIVAAAAVALGAPLAWFASTRDRKPGPVGAD